MSRKACSRVNSGGCVLGRKRRWEGNFTNKSQMSIRFGLLGGKIYDAVENSFSRIFWQRCY